jgi:hypothetical protein
VSIPGPAGVLVISAIRFVTYVLAAKKLKQHEPTLNFEPRTPAIWLTVLGILIMPLEVWWLFLSSGGLANHGPYPGPMRQRLSACVLLGYFACWIVVLWAATRTSRLQRAKLYFYAAAGTVLSIAIDFVGFVVSALLPDGGYLD